MKKAACSLAALIAVLLAGAVVAIFTDMIPHQIDQLTSPIAQEFLISASGGRKLLAEGFQPNQIALMYLSLSFACCLLLRAGIFLPPDDSSAVMKRVSA